MLELVVHLFYKTSCYPFLKLFFENKLFPFQLSEQEIEMVLDKTMVLFRFLQEKVGMLTTYKMKCRINIYYLFILFNDILSCFSPFCHFSVFVINLPTSQESLDPVNSLSPHSFSNSPCFALDFRSFHRYILTIMYILRTFSNDTTSNILQKDFC